MRVSHHALAPRHANDLATPGPGFCFEVRLRTGRGKNWFFYTPDNKSWVSCIAHNIKVAQGGYAKAAGSGEAKAAEAGAAAAAAEAGAPKKEIPLVAEHAHPLVSLLDVRSGFRVLEVGVGAGYRTQVRCICRMLHAAAAAG